MLNLWNSWGFIIQTLSDYNAIVEGCKIFSNSMKYNYLLGLIVQCMVKYTSTLYKSIVNALFLPMGITMHITYSNISKCKDNLTSLHYLS